MTMQAKPGTTDTQQAGGFGLVTGIDPVLVRAAVATDEGRLVAMIERTSQESLYRRFHGATGSIARREMHRIANPTACHRSWVAVSGGDVHGTVTLVADRAGAHEVAILVEDDWTHRGIGGLLLEAAMADAGRQRVASVRAIVQPDNHRALAFFRAMVPGSSGRWADGELELALPVPRPVPTLHGPNAPIGTGTGDARWLHRRAG